MNSKLKMLCELYDRSNDGNIDIETLLKVCFIKDFKEILKLLSHKQCIKFAYLCAKSVSHLCNKYTKEKVKKCLELVEKWLENPVSVSDDELRKVANTAYAIHVDAIHVATNATYAATNATYAAANAAYAAAAAYVVAYAIYVADNAVNAADNAVNAVKNKQEQAYKNLGFLVKVIKDEP